jgi:hypothetical protein
MARSNEVPTHVVFWGPDGPPIVQIQDAIRGLWPYRELDAPRAVIRSLVRLARDVQQAAVADG